MDWWKARPAVKDSQCKTVKSNDAKKHVKPKTRPEQLVADGQSTLLAFVGSKEETLQVPAPLRREEECETDLQNSPKKITRVSNPPELPIPPTPLNSRVDLLSSELDDTEPVENTKPIEINDCVPGIQEQAEPTRRSARLKSIQVKQALKDESVFDDDDDDDFQTRKIRTKVTTVSKGKLFFLSKEEKEKLKAEEERRIKEEEEERQRERERQQCERLREEIKRAKEENLQRSAGRQTNPFLLPRAVPSSLSIVIDADEEITKGCPLVWEDDHDGTLFPFPLKSHVTQNRDDVVFSKGEIQEEDTRHNIYEILISSTGHSSFLREHIRSHLDIDISHSLVACNKAEKQHGLTSFQLSNWEAESSCDKKLDDTSKIAISIDQKETQGISIDTNSNENDMQSRNHFSLDALADRCGHSHSDAKAIFERLRHRHQADDSRKLWADTYRPRHSNEVCGNQDKVRQLRKWLIESDRDSSSKRHKLPTSSRKRKESDEDDDFDMEDTSCQAILISGPPGCGKSSAVYAVAEELKLQVLEINSSDKRCGRLVLDKVGEATRSQSLMKRAAGEDALSNASISSTNDSTFSEKRKHGRIKKTSDLQMHTCKEVVPDFGAGAALILFEEIDVLLDHDKGFLTAVIALVEQTCVPIVMTCQQKPSMMSGLGLRELEWHTPVWRDAGLYLNIISALEDSEPVFEDIHSTYTFLNSDFRRTLMMLQLASVRPCLSSAPFITNDVSLQSTTSKCSYIPRFTSNPVAIAQGFQLNEPTKLPSQFLDGNGEKWSLSLKRGIAEKLRMLEGNSCCLDMVFNTKWDEGGGCCMEDHWKMADAMSCASLMSDADTSRRESGGSLVGNMACLVACCIQMRGKSKEFDWLTPGNERQSGTSKHQKSFTSELVYPRVWGIERSNSIMLEYAPWVREICLIEEQKKYLGASRRRRATHHLSDLSHEVVECFASSPFMGSTTPPFTGSLFDS